MAEILWDDPPSPVEVQWDDQPVPDTRWNPEPPKPSRARSALDALLSGTSEVASETNSMLRKAAGFPSPETFASETVRGILESDLPRAIAPTMQLGSSVINAIGAPFKAGLGGIHALTVEPIGALAGMSPEDLGKARSHFETIVGNALPVGLEVAAAERGAGVLSQLAREAGGGAAGEGSALSEAANAKRTPVVDPETGATILKNPPADEALQQATIAQKKARGIDPTDTQEVAAHIAEREGIPASQVEASVNPDMPISKTETGANGVSKVQIEPGTPGEEVTRLEHEVGNHVPEQQGLREAPVEDNNALALEGLEKERATYATPVEPGQGNPGPHVPDDVNPALDAIKGAREEGEQLSDRAKIAGHYSKEIEETGTLPKDQRYGYREAGPKPVTENLRISAADVSNYGRKLVQAVRSLREAYKNPNLQDPFSQLGIKMAMDQLEDATARWTALRFGSGRTVGRFNKALTEALSEYSPAEIRKITQILRASGVQLEGSQIARSALWTEGWKSLAKGEVWEGVGDLTRFASMNLFSALSWSVDGITSLYRHTGQATGYALKDAMWVAKGHPNFPNIGAYFRALKRGNLPESIATELGGTVGGEAAPGAIPFRQIGKDIAENYRAGGIRGALGTELEVGPGVATYRENLPSFLFDEATMGPAYLKRTVDTASGKVGASVKLNALADEAANARGLRGASRDPLVADIIKSPEKYALDGRSISEAAEEAANQAGVKGMRRDEFIARYLNEESIEAETLRTGHELQWKVPISEAEQHFNDNTFVRMFFSAFPAWPSQFVRGMADMLGVRPTTWARIAKRGFQGQDIAEVLGRAGTGFGSLYFANKFYNNVDFDSMELIVPVTMESEIPDWMKGSSPGRIRLSSVDPFPELFGALAAIKGDKYKAAAALKHGSIPIVSALARFSGLFTPIVRNFQTFAERGSLNAAKASKDAVDAVNSLFPAQAVMSAFKSLVDPVNRRGIGAFVPGVSFSLPAKIDATTGEESITQQRIGDVRFRNISGAPIRGATRDTDAVFELLDYFYPEAIVRSGVRTPYADTAVADIPQEQQDEYKKIFGKLRWEFMTQKRFGALAGKFQDGTLLLKKGSPEYERVRQKVQILDSTAANIALAQMQKKYGIGKPVRKPTILEMSGASLELPEDTYEPADEADTEQTPEIKWDEDVNPPKTQ